MNKQALQLMLALGLVIFCVAKATAKLEEVRHNLASVQQDVLMLQIQQETIDHLVMGHEHDLRAAGLIPKPELPSDQEELSEASPPAGPSTTPHRRR